MYGSFIYGAVSYGSKLLEIVLPHKYVIKTSSEQQHVITIITDEQQHIITIIKP